MPSTITPLDEVAGQFVEVVDTCFGLYLDCSSGFWKNHEALVKNQHLTFPSVSKEVASIQTLEDLDTLETFLGRGPPTDPKNILYHKCTQGEFKRRNSRGGTNEQFLGRYCVVLLYEYWESEYRKRFADAAGLPREQLTNDLFGDLRHLRNAVLHNR